MRILTISEVDTIRGGTVCQCYGGAASGKHYFMKEWEGLAACAERCCYYVTNGRETLSFEYYSGDRDGVRYPCDVDYSLTGCCYVV